MSSKSKRGGLGRGLGALIPTAPPVPQPSADDAPASDSGSGDVAAPAVGTGRNGVARNADGHGGKGDAGGGVTAPHAARSADDAEVGTTHSDVALAAVPGAALAELAIADIHPNPRQPRRVFDEDALNELSHSIREFGVLQPVVVRSDPSAAGGYELVMGERRLRAAAAAGLPTIPAIVRTTDDDAMLRDALLENIHRAQLNPLEEAAAYQQLLDDFGSTHDELATRLGRSRPQVSNTIRLLNLSLPVQRRVAAGVLSAGHARALLSLPERDRQDELAGRIVAEGLSVRATEELVSLAQHDSAAPKAGRRSGGPRLTAPGVAALAADLSDAFDTSVRIDIGRRKGKITIEFASIDDLERLVDLVAPDVAAARRQGAAPAPGGGAQANEP